MKKAVTYFIILLYCLSCSTDSKNEIADEEITEMIEESVTIPDMAFEQALIDLNFDTDLDGKVFKGSIDFITELQINDKQITDLTGISAFSQLENLNVRGNNLVSIDVSENKALLFLWAEDNQLETINVVGLSSLEKIGADRNKLEQLNSTTNQALQFLTVSDAFHLTIDVSNNLALTDFSVVQNPLSCILVNQTQLDAVPIDWIKDDDDSYALDCQ